MPFFEYATGAYVAYSLFYNNAFYNLIFEGIYNTIWYSPVPAAIATYVPGYDDYLK